MSRKRQSAFLDRRGRSSAEVTGLTYDYGHGHAIPWHFHEWDQLVYASSGVMTVRTADGMWVVPTQRAVWIPARVPHTITMSGTVAMRTLYLKPQLAKSLPRDCCVANVSPLLKELILHACSFPALKKATKWQRHLIDVVLDQLEAVQTVPLQLPSLSDPRARRAAEILSSDPSDRQPLAQTCKLAGASKRTLERLFHDEAGMTLGKWRQQLRLMKAMQLLAEGAKVTHAAMEAGYSTPSAFISMFRKSLGTTPARFFGDGGFRATAPRRLVPPGI
jgi:AraC-like DNA-binding protein/quercetin dioxygenase-like cupin family protein